VLHVRKGYRGPSVTLSRTHPNLVKKLFAMEVPEIASGAVEIAAIAREAGHRSKIAVISHQPGVNAKGACIGPMGSRVRNVMTELHGEKIDIVDYSPDPAQFVAHALSPARVTKVNVVDLQARVAQVIVPDYQLSLAIGKEGQNARLAARLTGWRIDIRPDTGEAGPAAASAAPDAAAAADAAAGSRVVTGPHAVTARGAVRAKGTPAAPAAGAAPARETAPAVGTGPAQGTAPAQGTPAQGTAPAQGTPAQGTAPARETAPAAGTAPAQGTASPKGTVTTQGAAAAVRQGLAAAERPVTGEGPRSAPTGARGPDAGPATGPGADQAKAL